MRSFQTTTRASMCWALAVACCVPFAVQAQTSYHVVILGKPSQFPLSDGATKEVRALGAKGEVIWGTGFLYGYHGSGGWEHSHMVAPPYASKYQEVRELLSPDGYAFTFARAVNAQGVVVGNTYELMEGARYQAYPTRWVNGQVEYLTDGGAQVWGGEAWGINDAGQIVGAIDSGDWFDGQSNGSKTRPVLWDQGRLQQLPIPTGSNGRAVAINHGGVTVGYATDVDGHTSPIRWHGTKMQLLPTDGLNGHASAINAKGVIVGYLGNDDRDSLAAMWRDRGKTLVRLSGSSGASMASGINSKGQVVGWVSGLGGVLWQPTGEMVRLADLVPAEWKAKGWKLGSMEAINDRGEIAGYCYRLAPAVPADWGWYAVDPCLLRPVP